MRVAVRADADSPPHRLGLAGVARVRQSRRHREPGDRPTEGNAERVFYWDRYRQTTVGRYRFRHEYAFVVRALGQPSRTRRVLDLGCGSGRLALPLYGAGFGVAGLDPDEVALAACRRRSEAIPPVRGDAQRLPFATGSVDGVVAIQSLDYVDHRQFLRESSRVLLDGGVLVFDVLNRHSYKWWLKRLAGRGLALPSANLSAPEVLRSVRDHGFVVQQVAGYSWIPFDRHSDSRWVGLAAWMERALRLDRRARFAPKLLIAARKVPAQVVA